MFRWFFLLFAMFRELGEGEYSVGVFVVAFRGSWVFGVYRKVGVGRVFLRGVFGF